MNKQCKAIVIPRNRYPKRPVQCTREAAIGEYCLQHHGCYTAGTLTSDGRKKAVPTWKQRAETAEETIRKIDKTLTHCLSINEGRYENLISLVGKIQSIIKGDKE